MRRSGWDGGFWRRRRSGKTPPLLLLLLLPPRVGEREREVEKREGRKLCAAAGAFKARGCGEEEGGWPSALDLDLAVARRGGGIPSNGWRAERARRRLVPGLKVRGG